ncbi:c6 zinc finger protein [Ophiostoma piceae UAMH 11346]|uniref:C6 zinc finger protein n=1 Tax=Ophiostoma piceae (strain UAMH 11346) TaxID=1262450 RepID=S3BP35_OPHP1|nr:c6 zinc finger protein [Ophiostoma piceae UAMH 11346]
MVGAIGNQQYPGSLNGPNKIGLNNNSNNNNNNNGNMGATNLVMRPQAQRSSSFAISGQQIRTVGDFQALQRANSDISSLSPLGINSLGADLDFSALR